MTHASTASFPRHPRLRSFARRFGRAHLDFACHAAFPLALTPDLLYLLWAAFPRDARDQPIGTPWVAVADLLLSSLCDEVGHELFEFEPEVRDELLPELKSSPRFGPARFAALAAFVSEYVGQQLRSSDPFVRDFAEAQHWAARSATDPAGAAAKLARAYAELRGTERDRLLRLEAIIEAIARPERASDIESLLPYARALADWARGDQARAATVLRSMANSTGQIFLGELVLPLPPAIAAPASDVISTAGPGGPVQQAIPVPSTNNEELAELRRQMEEAQRRLNVLEQQRAYTGSHAPFSILNSIQEARAQLAKLNAQIKELSGEFDTPAIHPVEEIAHLQALRMIQSRRLDILQEQRAGRGVFVSPDILNEISVLTQELETTEQQLREYGAPLEASPTLDEFSVPLRAEERAQLEELRETYQRRLQVLESQQVSHGILTAPHIIMDAQDARAAIAKIDKQLSDDQESEFKTADLDQPSTADPNQPSSERAEDAGYEEKAGEWSSQVIALHKLLATLQLKQDNGQLTLSEQIDLQDTQMKLDAKRAELLATRQERLAQLERRVMQPGRASDSALVADLAEIRATVVEETLTLRRHELEKQQALFRIQPSESGRAQVQQKIDALQIEIADLVRRRDQTTQATSAVNDKQADSLVTPTRTQLEQQRADILRRLEQLEQRSHRTPEPTPQSEIEAAELRRQLDEIERQIAALPAEAGAQQTAPDIEVSPDEAPLTNISLHIARQGSGYSISLVSGTSIMQATLAPSEAQLEELAGLARRRLDEVVKTQVDGQLVYQSPQATIAPEVHAQSLRALAEAGSFMHQQLFFRPDSGRDSHVLGNRLRELSQRARLRITIISERLFLPWALLYDREIIEPGNIDAEGFWGFKHVIECQLPSTAPQQSAVLSFEDVVGEASPIIVPGGQLELGFVGDNAVDAQFSQPIVVQQRASMSSLPRVHVQDYSSASDFYRLLSDGIAAADIVYMYCLMDRNSDTGTGDVRIRLGDQDISLRELRARLPVTPLPGRPFVFMNAERVLNADLTQIDSFVPYFLQRGARAVLGGEASLPAFFAAQFGVEFVSRFVAGEQSAGNLLLALRRAYLTQRNNLLGLIYTLYGHADTQVEWDEPEAEQEIPRPARKGERPATKRAPGSAAALPASILEQLREQLNDLLTELEASNDLPLRDAENLHAHLELAIQAAEQDVPNRQQILDKLSAMGKITRSLRSRYDSARILDQQISSAQRSAKDLTSTPPTSFA